MFIKNKQPRIEQSNWLLLFIYNYCFDLGARHNYAVEVDVTRWPSG